MNNYQYVYGPVPSRRMGLSLGVSPIPQGYCNYSCIYCQLGRTSHMSNKREMFFEVEKIIDELKQWFTNKKEIDVITIVGEGEPTLYAGLGDLIVEIKKLTEIPVAVITNGALMANDLMRLELMAADIVLPSFDAGSEDVYKKINRPHGEIEYDEQLKGLKTFSQAFKGQLWIETMLVKGLNDTEESLMAIKNHLDQIKYQRIFINTPVRPPAEVEVEEPTLESLERAVNLLGGTAINQLASYGFFSDITDDYEAVKSIIKRHPMNQFEIRSFLESRECIDIDKLFKKLDSDISVSGVAYKGYITYRG